MLPVAVISPPVVKLPPVTLPVETTRPLVIKLPPAVLPVAVMLPVAVTVVKAATLKSKNTDILITTGGEAFVNSTESLDIKIRAGGDVFIYGKPKKVTKNKVLGGRIKYMH